jgi:FAD/FMN-containing dehydrogenase
MIPALSESPNLHPLTAPFLEALRKAGFEGDIDTRLATRLSAATDNSIYQVLPEAVVFPRTIVDIPET